MNENPDGLPEEFVRQVLSRIDSQALATYPEYEPLERMIATQEGLPPECVQIGNGSDALLRDLFAAFVAPGDSIVIADPSFAMYSIYARTHDARIVAVPYAADREFPTGAFLARVADRPRLAVIVNPNNPTGTALGADELIEIVTAARRHDVLTIVDEAYFHFHGESIITQAARFDNLVVTRTLSKLCSLAAVRLGYAAASPSILGAIRKVRPTYDINGVAVQFGLALLREPGLVDGLVAAALEGRDWLVEQLSRAGIGHVTGRANFVLIDCGGRVEEIAGRLAREGILTKAGFSQPYLRPYLRITYGRRPTMERFWKAFGAVWATPP